MHDMAAQLLILHVEGAATYLGPDWCAHCRHIEDIAAAHGVGRARVALQSCKTGGGALASCSRAAQKQRPHCGISIPTSVPLSRQPRTREARVRRRREHDILCGALQARGIDGGRVGRDLWWGGRVGPWDVCGEGRGEQTPDCREVLTGWMSHTRLALLLVNVYSCVVCTAQLDLSMPM